MTPPTRKSRRQAKPSPRNFYLLALTEAEQLELSQAEGVDGLDDEIAVLRVRLKTAIQEQPDDLTLLLKGIDLVVKAVATRYRLSPRARGDLADNIAAVLNSLSEQLAPPVS